MGQGVTISSPIMCRKCGAAKAIPSTIRDRLPRCCRCFNTTPARLKAHTKWWAKETTKEWDRERQSLKRYPMRHFHDAIGLRQFQAIAKGGSRAKG